MSTILTRLANEHRSSLNQISVLAIRDLSSLFSSVSREPDAVWARTLRIAAPTIMRSYGGVAAQLSSAFYNKNRAEQNDIFNLAMPRFTSAPAKTLQRVEPIVTPNLKSIDYFINSAFAEEKPRPRQTANSLIQQAMHKGVYDFSREVISDSAQDDPRGEEPERAVSAKGCDFCKLMAVAAGDTEKKYHDFCSCVESPLFSGGGSMTQVWKDDFMKEYNEARDFVSDDNSITTKNVLQQMRLIRQMNAEE